MTGCVHYSDWAQQPDVELVCGRWTTPAWEFVPDGPLPEGVYRGDNGDLYTFSHWDLVTCQECLGKRGHAGPI